MILPLEILVISEVLTAVCSVTTSAAKVLSMAMGYCVNSFLNLVTLKK
ncbi:hypothetical protein HRD78_13820 [Enterococcus faecalis]|nr:hypothetical protein [Enterococcus faecalis]